MNRAAAVRVAVVAALSALVVLAARVLRGDPAPVFSTRGPFPEGTIDPERASPVPTSPSTATAPAPAPDPAPAPGEPTELFPPDGAASDPVPDPATDAPTDGGDTGSDAGAPVPDRPTATGGPATDPTPARDAVAEAEGASAAGADQPNPPGERWVFPVDGECPESHPIKAKLRSGLYHLPGMMAYDRAKPDRCYATEVDARADGLRRAKR